MRSLLRVRGGASRGSSGTRSLPNWYGRFVIFRDMGPGRSLTGCVQIYYARRHKPAHPVNVTWCENARVWKWRERALAWDQYQRDLMTLVEANRKAAARERRTAVINENIDTAREMIRAADLENLSKEEARALFPEARRYLKDMIEADRKEYDKNLYDVDAEAGGAEPLRITADDLRAAQREWEKREAEEAAKAEGAEAADGVGAGYELEGKGGHGDGRAPGEGAGRTAADRLSRAGLSPQQPAAGARRGA